MQQWSSLLVHTPMLYLMAQARKIPQREQQIKLYVKEILLDILFRNSYTNSNIIQKPSADEFFNRDIKTPEALAGRQNIDI